MHKQKNQKERKKEKHCSFISTNKNYKREEKRRMYNQVESFLLFV